MTKHPSLVSGFIQYNDSDPFDPVIFKCAVNDLVKADNYYGKLTAIVRYYTPYTFNDVKPVLILLMASAVVTIHYIIRLPTISQWGCMIDI